MSDTYRTKRSDTDYNKHLSYKKQLGRYCKRNNISTTRNEHINPLILQTENEIHEIITRVSYKGEFDFLDGVSKPKEGTEQNRTEQNRIIKMIEYVIHIPHPTTNSLYTPLSQLGQQITQTSDDHISPPIPKLRSHLPKDTQLGYLLCIVCFHPRFEKYLHFQDDIQKITYRQSQQCLNTYINQNPSIKKIYDKIGNILNKYRTVHIDTYCNPDLKKTLLYINVFDSRTVNHIEQIRHSILFAEFMIQMLKGDGNSFWIDGKKYTICIPTIGEDMYANVDLIIQDPNGDYYGLDITSVENYNTNKDIRPIDIKFPKKPKNQEQTQQENMSMITGYQHKKPKTFQEKEQTQQENMSMITGYQHKTVRSYQSVYRILQRFIDTYHKHLIEDINEREPQECEHHKKTLIQMMQQLTTIV